MSQPTSRIIGCDVSKAEVVTHNSHTGRTSTVPNRLDKLEPFLAVLDPDCLLVCENTGGYEALNCPVFSGGSNS